MASKSFAWSYSQLTSFETCAYRYQQLKDKVVVEAQSEELLWGNRVHKALELRVKNRTPLPDTMTAYEPIAVKVLTAATGGQVEAEQKLALDRDYNPTTYFSKDVWVRVITDVTITKQRKAVILDYKTGKPTPASAQLKLCAAATFHNMPYIQTVSTGFLWLKDGSITAETYSRADIPAIWQEFAPRVLRLERAIESERFPKNPSGLCRKWCPVKHCEHNGNYVPGSRYAA